MTDIPKIPIQNIYYLLCYAWNKLDEQDVVDIRGIDSTELLDLFAKVLIGGLNHIFKRGLDRGYITYSMDSKCLRGKICLSQTLKRNLLTKAQANCEFDELSYNVLHNQIIKASLRTLIHVEYVDKELKQDLIGLYRKMGGIEDIHLTKPLFFRVQLHRNNFFYDFLLKICELIYDNLLVSEEAGKSKFKDFLQDEKKMPYLFESFVRNFYKIEARNCRVHREDIFWDVTPLDDQSSGYLPKMTTDISIEFDNSKAVIDTKYYKEALISNFNHEKFHSAHLYQIFSYLKNLEAKGGINEDCTGVLLYPTTNKDIEGNYRMDSHLMMIRTLNLSQDWKKIHNDLIELLEETKRIPYK